jgi:hypothetical protein
MPDHISDLASLRHLTDAGYRFYQDPSALRADDLAVRAEAAARLHRAATALATAERQARDSIPHPTRENPYPDPALLSRPRALRALLDQLSPLETRLRGPLALPDADFTTLIATPSVRQSLVTLDAALLTAAAALEAVAPSADIAAIRDALSAVDAAIQARKQVR